MYIYHIAHNIILIYFVYYVYYKTISHKFLYKFVVFSFGIAQLELPHEIHTGLVSFGLGICCSRFGSKGINQANRFSRCFLVGSDVFFFVQNRYGMIDAFREVVLFQRKCPGWFRYVSFLGKKHVEILESQFLYEAFGLGGQMLTVVGNRYRIRRR